MININIFLSFYSNRVGGLAVGSTPALTTKKNKKIFIPPKK
jgi:hypothetical protein